MMNARFSVDICLSEEIPAEQVDAHGYLSFPIASPGYFDREGERE